MNREILLGIGIGVISVGVVIACCYSINKLKKTIIIDEKIDTIDSKCITGWFKQYKKNYPKALMVICDGTISESTIGEKFNNSLDIPKTKTVIQFFYDNDKQKVLFGRLIEYNNIESRLQSALTDNKGAIVLDHKM